MFNISTTTHSLYQSIPTQPIQKSQSRRSSYPLEEVPLQVEVIDDDDDNRNGVKNIDDDGDKGGEDGGDVKKALDKVTEDFAVYRKEKCEHEK